MELHTHILSCTSHTSGVLWAQEAGVFHGGQGRYGTRPPPPTAPLDGAALEPRL